MVAMAEPEVRETSPPYLPFRTLMNLITRMESEGVPKRIDKSYLSNMAGGVQGHLWAALRSLDLMTADREPTTLLRALVQKGDERPALVRSLIEGRYSWAVELGLDATQDQLEEAFRANGPKLSPSTREKAITFFLQAANYGGVQLSRFYKAPALTSGGSRPATQRRPRKPANKPTQRPTPKGMAPTSHAGAGDEDMRTQYFQLLLKKAEEATAEEATALYDRIEKILGGEGGPQ